ncbi:MAG: hypothetical protein ACRC0V_11905 [Fusobacteriaceae bacterium]|uniref:hypothetical protein n=1 Tax=Romboutsia sp. TaxID=1965302 RepID=UPI003F3AE348
MNNNTQYVSVNTLLSKLHRELGGQDLNESDVIEWAGEALEFLKVEEIQETALAFLEVSNHHAELPMGFQMMIQIARNNKWEKENKISCGITPNTIQEQLSLGDEYAPVNFTDCNGNILASFDLNDYRPNLDFHYRYSSSIFTNTFYKAEYTPIRLANETLFNTMVCKDLHNKTHYHNEDEYTIIGTEEKRLRFSFQDGFIVMAFLRNAIDSETGYPLMPDNISYITAISYYVKWKLAERQRWNQREGSQALTEENRLLWLKYANQAKNYMKMPKSLDDYQDLLDQSIQLVPRFKKYYSYFGKIKKFQTAPYTHNIYGGYTTY